MNTYDLTIAPEDLFLLAKGDWLRSWEKMGAHPSFEQGTEGYRFALWCPDVKSVSVVGSFNDWDVNAAPLTCTETGGVWTGFVPGAAEGDLYKYYIVTEEGEALYKADPYAFWAECPPGTASRLGRTDGYEWHDKTWMADRAKADHMKRPLNIYEVHLGSWKRHDDGLDGLGYGEGGGSYLTYEELGDQLVSYAKDMGYTHLEIMPVMEHPFDGSWGYQVTGYFAPTSRYGTPDEFRAFVDACHQAGIGVILDWVPGGFCKDAQGLANFNGHMLYEKEEHPNWGTLKFDFSRGEVQTFLTSNILYWLENFHADGIRMDGVTSVLYLNFGIDDPGQKKFNKNGTEEDLVAIEYIQHVNTTVAKYHPDVMMMAEESTAWPLVTYPPADGGLGFHYKWDMGWMHDTLHYMQTDFPWRPGNHKLLTFSMMYAFNENFILAFSHDEVVHGKCSLIGRMPGDWWRQFAGMRSLAFYQMTHPGAKLNFMGNEIAQFIEWRYYEGIQFFLAEQYDTHRDFQHYIKALNNFYLENKALWQKAYSWDGFSWIDADNNEQSIISFVRKGENPDDDLIVLINFDPATRQGFRLGVPREGKYVEVFNSDAREFGGSGVINEGVFVSEEEPWNGCEESIVLTVSPLAGMILKRTGTAGHRKRKKAAKAETTAGEEKPKRTRRKKAEATDASEAPAKKTTRKTTATKAASSKTAAAKTADEAPTKAASAKKTTRKTTTRSAAAKKPKAE